jgi:hypothetical protein
MAETRFATVRDLYSAFPTAEEDVGVEATDQPSLDFVRSQVADGAWDAALSYCAYLLPRREAVWWACLCLRRMLPAFAPPDAANLQIAEAWVQAPDEQSRRAALNLGMQGDTRSPTTWVALAAGWSGGSMLAPEYGSVPAAPYQTARAVRAALLMANAQLSSVTARDVLTPCVEAGVRLATAEGST